MDEMIQEILTAEQQAGHVVTKAEREREKRIATAREEALALLAAKRKEIDLRIDQEIKARMEQISRKRQKLIDEAAGEAEALAKKAERNVRKAVAFLLDKLRAGEGYA